MLTRFIVLGALSFFLSSSFPSVSFGAAQETSKDAKIDFATVGAPQKESSRRSSWLIGGEFAPGFAVSTYSTSDQYQPLFFLQVHGAFDFTSNQCFGRERKDSIFCVEAMILLQAGFGYHAFSNVPLFRLTTGFEFDLYLGRQRTVALTLKWRIGYGRYGINAVEEQINIPEEFRLPREDLDRLEWGIGPGVLLQLGRFSAKAKGMTVYADLHWVSSINWGLVIPVGFQYRF